MPTRRVRFLTRPDVDYIARQLAAEQRRFVPETPATLPLRGGERIGGALLDSALGEPQQSFGGRYLYPTIFDKAAALFRSIVQNHPFVDGNKRMGLACMEIFLDLNGYLLAASEENKVATTLQVASQSNVAWQDLSRWIRRHARRHPE